MELKCFDQEPCPMPDFQSYGCEGCLSYKPLGSISKDEELWSKKQWDIINQLKAQVLFLSSKVNEMRASASKRRPKTKY